MFDLILSQGRVGDRAPRLIQGAAETAAALTARYEIEPRVVGTSEPAQEDDWAVSLRAAQSTLRDLAAAVDASFEAGRPPVIVASTCSSGLATMPVVARQHPAVSVLYIDGHGDFNTPSTTGTGYLGGMVLAGVCGLWDSGHGAGIDCKRTLLIGARDIDDDERALIDQAGVRVFPPTITPDAVRDAIGDAPVWIHIDWDVLEPGYVPADYTVPDGIVPDELRALLAAIPPSKIVGIEIAEFHPTNDVDVDRKATDTIVQMIEPVLDALSSREVEPVAPG